MIERKELLNSARRAGSGAVASGRWLADLVIDTAPRVPVRDIATLRAQHHDMRGDALADELIRGAALASAAVGAAAGAIASVEELAPPAWIALPLELVVDTLAVVAIELKLVAELHEVYGQPLGDSAGDRAWATVRSWAEQRGNTHRIARKDLVAIVRRRLIRRMGRNLSSWAPLFIGAAAGAAVNRRGTQVLGEALGRDLRRLRLTP